jgi:hypothetical protein
MSGLSRGQNEKLCDNRHIFHFLSPRGFIPGRASGVGMCGRAIERADGDQAGRGRIGDGFLSIKPGYLRNRIMDCVGQLVIAASSIRAGLKDGSGVWKIVS